MLKITTTSSFDFGMPAASLVGTWSRGVDRDALTKRAAVLTQEIRSLRGEPGHSFIHLISMGAMESTGSNRNGDSWNEKAGEYKLEAPAPGIPAIIMLDGGLTKYHHTFKKSGHVFKHHRNQDPSLAIGEIAYEAYNPEMHRGELIIKVANDHPDWKYELEKLAQGNDIAFSMSARVPYDLCNVCGHRSRTRAEYCPHAADHLTEIMKSGHQISVINDAPHFFDISKVAKPADRIAWSLQKVAASDPVVSGAELAERAGLTFPKAASWLGSPAAKWQKLAATVKKLAAIEKQIEGLAKGQDNAHLRSTLQGLPTSDLDDENIGKLRSVKLEEALSALSDAQICLSVRDFLRLVLGPSKSGPIQGLLSPVKDRLPGAFSRLLEGDGEPDAPDYGTEPVAVPRAIKELVQQLVGDHSLATGPAVRRIRIMVIRGAPATGPRHSEKRAAVLPQPEADRLAEEYVRYQLAFASRCPPDSLGCELTVFRNYATV